MEIYKNLKAQLNKKGIDIIDVDYYDLIQVWKSWYSGNVGASNGCLLALLTVVELALEVVVVLFSLLSEC